MKKGIVIIVLIAMFGWAVYTFAFQEKNTDEEVAEKETGEVNFTTEERSNKNDTVGLEQGNIAPDFELKTLDNEVVKLSDYRGKRVMLNFWASWCGPCRAEMPDMEKFHQTKDVVILAVNLTDSETNRSNITDFVDEYSLTFPILLDETNKVAELYMIKPIPTSYLIDTKGRIHNVAFGALNYDLMVQEFARMN